MTLSQGRPAFTPADPPVADDVDYLRVDGPPSGGTVVLPGLAGTRIVHGDVLEYDWLPVAGGGDRYASTAFALDLVLDDGSRSSGSALVDQQGTLMDADAQARSKRAWVDQWNRRIVDLSPLAGRRIVEIRASLAETASADPVRTVFVDAPAVRPSEARPGDLLGWVDTRRGTRSSDRFSRGNNAPIVTLPHGGVFGLPMTDAGAGNWPYRWQSTRPSLQAFATSHIPSPWIGDRGVFQLMPSPLLDPDVDRAARALGFDRRTEHAGPDHYAVELEGVSALLTAGRHVVGMRFRSAGENLSLIVDHLGEAVAATWQEGPDDLRLDVRIRDVGQTLDHFVHVVFPRVRNHRLMFGGGELRGVVVIDGAAADVLVGVSTIDAETARSNAGSNAGSDGGVDGLLDRAARAWRSALARVEIPEQEAVSDDVLRSIAGGLGRVFSYPNAHDEPGPTGPRYRSPVDGEVRSGPFSSNNGFWDTYRTAWPLLGLLAPQTTARLADGFVQHFSDAGWVARWSAPGPVDCMTGTTSDTVFAGLAALGVPFRVDEAYRSAFQHATVAAADGRVGRKGLRPGIFRGYIDTATHEGMSWTLDNAINDASASRLARLLAAEATGERRERLETEGDYLARRALGYRNVFHGDPGFFIGRDPDGAWRVAGDAFDPAEWGHDYTETNAWGTSVTAPHDGAGLAALYGGEGALAARLDEILATPESAEESVSGSYGFVIHEMNEARDVRMGMIALSNQPAHHIPFMYMFTGRHDDAHRLVVEARDRLFVGSEIGQGYPGDEDNGEMSAWYLFSVLGLYPLVPGSGEFVLTPPLLPRIVLHPEGRAHPLEIVTTNPGRPFIRSVRIDGELWDRVAVPAEDLLRARRVEVELADEPTGWARASRPGSFSTEFGVEPLRDLLTRAPDTPADDAGETPLALTPGGFVDLALPSHSAVGMYTVTLGGEPQPLPAGPADESTASWRLLGIRLDGSTVLLDEREAAVDVAGRTRPFRIASPEKVVALRFEAVRALDLAQLEAFA
ncbi:GH92 family glycosyl hydrolase [Labedella endophytica]|nr:GH92 family glycosyl hydrolase [Labedella endophytica]